ncbi:cation:proton antiporter [Propylenella binzhouense]|uniref:Cation:proton antiporter n=1 Tax=Propylenella binzhouense TaxID=2555902 RepID=A0A964WRU4_9HYPH|nr:cation:proton antiporter [Propylenella binzhouense]MYZ46279.1 cation:proton antiporter [Propylenella binzhouense]
MEHALHLFLLLVTTRLFGEFSERIGQPASMGEIVAGVAIALGAAAALPLPLLADLPESPFLDVAAEFGIFFLLLLAGIEMRPSEIAEHSGGSLAVALGGVLLPLAGGFALAWAFLPETSLKFAQALLVGVALSISAVPVTVRIFMELGLLHTRVGRTVVSAAIFDDVIGLMLLAVLTGVIETGVTPDVGSMLVLLGKVGAFFVISVAAGLLLYPRIARMVDRLRIPAPHFSALMAVALAFAILAELLGMDFILGPFMAGLFFDPAAVGEEPYVDVKQSIGDVTNGLLAPLFFASIGVRVDLGAVTAVPGFLLALLATAFLGKLIGAGVPARLTGLSSREAVAVGVGMSGRGAVELIIASIALEAGLFDQPDPVVANLFSALVIMAVVTTLVTPLGLRRVLAAVPSCGGGNQGS